MLMIMVDYYGCSAPTATRYLEEAAVEFAV